MLSIHQATIIAFVDRAFVPGFARAEGALPVPKQKPRNRPRIEAADEEGVPVFAHARLGGSTMRRILAVAAALALIGPVSPVLAHVTAQPESAVAGSYLTQTFTVPHGCNGSATISLRIKIPEGVTSVKPQMKAGWNVTIKTRALASPLKGEGGQTITETVDEVAWRGGPLPNNLYDTFGLAMKLPDASGQTLYFPVVQECEQGVNRWIEMPAAGQSRKDLRTPAPTLKLTPKSP